MGDNKVSVKVMLNQDTNFLSDYAPGNRLVEAASFELDYPEVGGVEQLLEHVYEQLNVGGDIVPATEWTTKYRAEGNRSLSVGDVVLLGETAWTCSSFGWQNCRVAVFDV
jgi:hypothetical protein